MNIRTLFSVAIVLVMVGIVASPPADALMAGSSKIDLQSSLTRPPSPPDSDAKGTLRVRTDTKKDTHRFEIKAKRVDPLATLELWVEDDVAVMQFIANLVSDGDDEQKYRVDTKNGDALPHAAASNAELAGRAVEIRDTGLVVLQGTVPDVGGLGDGKAKVKLQTPPSPPVAKAKGKVSLRSKMKKGDQRFEIDGKRLPFATSGPFFVWLEDDVGVMQNIGELPQLGSSDKGRLRLRTKDGDSLPLDATNAKEFGGRDVEIRDAFDVVYLERTIPSF